MKQLLKTILKPIADFFRKITAKLMDPVSERIVREIQYSSAKTRDNLIPYYPGEKIRILFLFQMASLWPSWESFYESCVADPRFSVTFTLLKEDNPVSMSQMLTAESFLQSKGIPYVLYSDALMAATQPHVVVLQTPYDWYRQAHVKSSTLLRYGTRLIYITYGIEIADTEQAQKDHFTTAVRNCWRIYTFSDRMRADYATYCENGIAARSFGHPKFDALFHKEQFVLPAEVQSIAHGRPVVLWHLHFPKILQRSGKSVMTTPYLSEYLKFVDTIRSSEDFFFIVQIHPKFLDCEEPLRSQAQKLIESVASLPNVYVDKDDDYRPCLVGADYIITDRSAIMVEGAAVGVPIQYMSNADYSEPLTEAVRPLVESYVQGHTAEDMSAFVEECRKGLDTQKEIRERAFRECIPYFDGHCGERIKNDIAFSLMSPEQLQLEALMKLITEGRSSDRPAERVSPIESDDTLRILEDPRSMESLSEAEMEVLEGKLRSLEMKIRDARQKMASISLSRADSTANDH